MPRKRNEPNEDVVFRVAQLFFHGKTVREIADRVNQELRPAKPLNRESVYPLLAEARRRTRGQIELPDEESFSIEFVTGKPWGGYNWYEGGFHSRIEVNTDLPIFLAGGGYKHGEFREVSREVRHKVPLCNLYVDIAQKMGVETSSFGSSTGRFS